MSFAEMLKAKKQHKVPAITMSDEEYHAHEAMSQSKMKVLLESPRKFYIQHILKIQIDEKTKSKNLGTCLDLALTEPDKYNQLIVKNTKTTTVEGCVTVHWKTLIDEWIADLYQYRFDDDFFDNVTFKDIIDTCSTQDKIFYRYQDIAWRLKTDFLNVENGFFIDVKSTCATTYKDFVKQFFNYGYHIQAASYTIGIREAYGLDYNPRAYYIAISTVTGEIFAIKCSNQMIQLGMMEIDRGCAIYNENWITNQWAKNQPLQNLEVPNWLQTHIITQNQEINT